MGQPPGGFPDGIVAKVLKGDTPNVERPGKSLAPVDLDAERAKLSDLLEGREIDDEDLNGYLMYPKVFLDYMGRHRTYGPVRVLPTRTFFYGMEPTEEISAEIDPGKTLEIRLQAIGETLDDGEVKVFFELNGQPRVIRVPNRRSKQQQPHGPKPIPQTKTTLAHRCRVSWRLSRQLSGPKVAAGDLLLTIEAMKMETGIHAERDAVIKAVHVQAGAQIDAKDLLIELE